MLPTPRRDMQHFSLRENWQHLTEGVFQQAHWENARRIAMLALAK